MYGRIAKEVRVDEMDLYTCYNDDFPLGSRAVGRRCDLLDGRDVFEDLVLILDDSWCQLSADGVESFFCFLGHLESLELCQDDTR